MDGAVCSCLLGEVGLFCVQVKLLIPQLVALDLALQIIDLGREFNCDCLLLDCLFFEQLRLGDLGLKIRYFANLVFN